MVLPAGCAKRAFVFYSPFDSSPELRVESKALLRASQWVVLLPMVIRVEPSECEVSSKGSDQV
jgi:hypothetical protein